jgi:hypothetical protein
MAINLALGLVMVSGDDAELVLGKLLKSTSTQVLLSLLVSKINSLLILKGKQETDPVSGHHHIARPCRARNCSHPDEQRQAFFSSRGPFSSDHNSLTHNAPIRFVALAQDQLRPRVGLECMQR